MFENTTRSRAPRRGLLQLPTVLAAVAAHAVCAYGITALPRAAPAEDESVEMATYLLLRAPERPAPPVSTPADEVRRDPHAPTSRAAPVSRRPPAPNRADEPAPEPDLQLARVSELALATIPRILDVIPPSGPALDSALLRGLGDAGPGEAVGSAAGGAVPGEDDAGGAPVVEAEVFATPPRMLNRFLVRRLMGSDYPERLMFRGIEGQVLVSFIIGLDGRPEMDHVRVVSATHQDFIPAALRGLRRMRFRPAQLDGRPVRVRVSLPMVWNLAGSG